MIKITYDTVGGDMKKPEKTTVNIFPGKMFIRYNVPNKAQGVVDKMREDGKKNVLYSRGVMIQTFPGKTEQQILEIAKKDIENGLYIAKQKTKKELKIENMKIQ